MNYFDELPIELQELILDYTGIHCHVCQSRFNINFYKKNNNFYFCSKACYDLV